MTRVETERDGDGGQAQESAAKSRETLSGSRRHFVNEAGYIAELKIKWKQGAILTTE